MAKLDFSKETIEYNGSNYNVKLEGEDEKGAGGLWDMAGAFAEVLLYELDGGACCDEDLIAQNFEIIQEHTYNLIKYGVLEKLENQLNKQNQSEM